MSDKMREEFEKDYGQIYLQKEADGSYSGPYAQIAWNWWQKAWKSSRAALVVNITVHEEFDKRMFASNVYRELSNAGISYE